METTETKYIEVRKAPGCPWEARVVFQKHPDAIHRRNSWETAWTKRRAIKKAIRTDKFLNRDPYIPKFKTEMIPL